MSTILFNVSIAQKRVFCWAWITTFLVITAVFPGKTIGQAPSKTNAGLSNEEIVKKLNNPVATPITVPFENNTDFGIGDLNATLNVMKLQPVVPAKLSPNLNLISRVIVPFVTQYNIYDVGAHQTGLADVLASFFISPAATKNGFFWGAGPVFLLPAATNDYLGSKKWGAGPTTVFLQQAKGWTYGSLVNQVWSFAGDEERPDVSQLYVQPFLIHNWKSGAGLGIGSEITEDWENNTTTIFIIPTVSGLTRIGRQTISLTIGPRINVKAPDGRKADFGIRSQIAFVFPK